MMKRSRGQYTPQQVKRCSQLGGEFGKEFHSLVSDSLGLPIKEMTRKASNKYKNDLKLFVREFSPDALFDYIPGREHKGFSDFVAKQALRSPYKLGKKLADLSTQMDFWRRRAQRARPNPNAQE